eukprot:TRINITY_DN8724_c0_g1_i2.p1 TRINITY_DN8724_c0_g1~~TRINITY_DN8724_c0_g1_i2.p1  ORF type:complete len:395 (+),score=68.20 TRINITY_DN8724_c0_g1_i2:85-1269(+)
MLRLHAFGSSVCLPRVLTISPLYNVSSFKNGLWGPKRFNSSKAHSQTLDEFTRDIFALTKKKAGRPKKKLSDLPLPDLPAEKTTKPKNSTLSSEDDIQRMLDVLKNSEMFSWPPPKEARPSLSSVSNSDPPQSKPMMLDYLQHLLKDTDTNIKNSENVTTKVEKVVKVQASAIEEEDEFMKSDFPSLSSEQHAHRMKQASFPAGYLDSLSTDILNRYKYLVPSEADNAIRVKLMARLQRIVDNLPSLIGLSPKLHLFGSSANNFGFKETDVDMCIIAKSAKDRDLELGAIRQLRKVLWREGFVDIEAILGARVPIVRFKDPQTSLQCDICVNNRLAVVNSRLVHHYTEIDPRFRPLGYVIKNWAKAREINEPYKGTLSSYAYVLMVLHFLQNRK